MKVVRQGEKEIMQSSRKHFFEIIQEKYTFKFSIRKNLCFIFTAFFVITNVLFECSSGITINKDKEGFAEKSRYISKVKSGGLNESTTQKLYNSVSCKYDSTSNETDPMDTLYIEKEQASYDSKKFPYRHYIREIIRNHKRIDTGRNFLNQIIIFNNRMDYYDLYIRLAKAKGYVVTSYVDYLTKYKDTNKKVLILRHDIDKISNGTHMMFDIERKNHVKATYYFRWSTYDPKLIKEIYDQGFEVGLHYETIATYCIKNRKNRVTTQDIQKCKAILKDEIKEFRNISGIDIKTISAHGTPVNKAVGVLNNVLVDEQSYKDYGIVGEAYDKDIIKNYVRSYICDNYILFKYGFLYKANPIDSILKNAKVIEFLSHPHHWYYTIDERANMYSILNN